MTYEQAKNESQALSRTSQQLLLFDPPRPLAQRLGEEFFRAAPRAPGVYIMTGPNERVLYIGQSGNLRARLSSYKNARPDRAPRKIIRLVRAATSITWEKCASAEAARLRENELLRRHRPRFNSINTYPLAYSFIALRRDKRDLELCRTNQPAESWRSSATPYPFSPSFSPHFADPASSRTPQAEVFVYGAFKTRCVAAFGALLRLLWAASHQPRSPHEFPSPLLAAKSPRRFRLTLAGPSCFHEHIGEHLHHFLEGVGDHLLQFIAASLPDEDILCPFHKTLQRADFETLAEFYHFGPLRNFQLRKHHQLPGRLIPQEDLDDLLALDHPAIREISPKNDPGSLASRPRINPCGDS